MVHAKIHLSPLLPPKVILKSAWQVQHDGLAQRGDSTGEPVADEMTIEPKIDLRLRGFSRAEVEQEGEKESETVKLEDLCMK